MTERQKELKELEDFFNSIILPTIPIKIDQASTILDVPKFVKATLQALRSEDMAEVNIVPRFIHLRQLKKVLS